MALPTRFITICLRRVGSLAIVSERRVEEEIRISDHGGHRRPDLVTHVREKFRLGAARLQAVEARCVELRSVTLEQLCVDDAPEERRTRVAALYPQKARVCTHDDGKSDYEAWAPRHEKKARRKRRSQHAPDVEPKKPEVRCERGDRPRANPGERQENQPRLAVEFAGCDENRAPDAPRNEIRLHRRNAQAGNSPA
jgi:hypothetical protein